MAKVVLDVAKVVLDVGKVVLDVAKVVLDVAKVVLDVAKVVLDVGKVVLDVGEGGAGRGGRWCWTGSSTAIIFAISPSPPPSKIRSISITSSLVMTCSKCCDVSMCRTGTHLLC